MHRSLDGTVVLLTRQPEDNVALAERLRDRGATVVELPCVRTEALPDHTELRQRIESLGPGDALAVTSAAGIAAVASVIAPDRLAAPLAVVGAATLHRAQEAGFVVAFTPSRSDGNALAEEMPIPRGTVVLARSDIARSEPVEILRRRGARVREVVAYRTIVGAQGDAEPARRALEQDAAIVVLASPSAVDGLVGAVGAEAVGRGRLVAIGATTAAHARERFGLRATVASAPSDEALLSAIEAAAFETVVL